MQNVSYHRITHLMALSIQFFRESSQTLACPSQGRLWVSPCRRVNELFQIYRELGVLLNNRFPPSAGLSHLHRFYLFSRFLARQFVQTNMNCATRNSCSFGYMCNTPSTKYFRLS